ncbi:MAG: hypothetical protein WDW38_006539 [Sanguina aurantia]
MATPTDTSGSYPGQSLVSRVSSIDSSSVVVWSVACVLLLVLIIAYIVWRIRRRDLKSLILVRDPVRLDGPGMPLTIDQSKIPTTLNGQEYSYSFWLYLVQYENKAAHTMIFGRGQGVGATAEAAVGGSPLVYLDQSTNKLYVSVAKNSAAATTTVFTDVQASTNFVQGVIDYVPMQRWVNVVIVVQDQLMTLFLDGDIYTVSNVTDTVTTATPRPVFGATSGSVVVGASPATNQQQAFLSQLQFFNFAMTMRDVKARYAGGPLAPSALSLLGIPAYGIRSPVYKLQ